MNLRAWARDSTVRKLLTPAIIVRRMIRNASLRDTLLKRVTSGVLTFDLPEFRGSFECNVHSAIAERLLFDGEYESTLAELCSKHLDPDRDAIDVGANIGVYSVLMGKKMRAGRVLALEPTPAAFALLRRNVERNGVNVLCEQLAASNAAGTASMNVCAHDEYSSLGPITHQSATALGVSTIAVRTTTIDALCLEYELRPGFLKLDVEGFELQVLEGAAFTLRNHKPIVLAEVYDLLLRPCGGSSAKVLALLHAAGYRTLNAERPSESVSGVFNGYTLAVPR